MADLFRSTEQADQTQDLNKFYILRNFPSTGDTQTEQPLSDLLMPEDQVYGTPAYQALISLKEKEQLT